MIPLAGHAQRAARAPVVGVLHGEELLGGRVQQGHLPRLKGVHDLLGDLIARGVEKARGDPAPLIVAADKGQGDRADHQSGGHDKHGAPQKAFSIGVAVGLAESREGREGVHRHASQHEQGKAQGRELHGDGLVEGHARDRKGRLFGSGKTDAQVAHITRQIQYHVGRSPVAADDLPVRYRSSPRGGLGDVLGVDRNVHVARALGELQLQMNCANGTVDLGEDQGDGFPGGGGQGAVLHARYTSGVGRQIHLGGFVAPEQQMEGVEVAHQHLPRYGEDQKHGGNAARPLPLGEQNQQPCQHGKADHVWNQAVYLHDKRSFHVIVGRCPTPHLRDF